MRGREKAGRKWTITKERRQKQNAWVPRPQRTAVVVWVKGDGRWHNFLVDWKFAKSSFKLDKNVWAKVVTDTIKSDKEKNPALIIVLGEGNETVRLAIIEQEVLEQLDSNNTDMV